MSLPRGDDAIAGSRVSRAGRSRPPALCPRRGVLHRCPPVIRGNAAADVLPTVPRHKVRVRGVETEFCKRGQRIPEWWHFPECDRHLYFAPEDDANPSVPADAHVILSLPPPSIHSLPSQPRPPARHTLHVPRPSAESRVCVKVGKGAAPAES